MSRFLRFAVTRALNKNLSSLKEYTIGVEVFDRPESFDPTIDPIVRVEARRLRTERRERCEKNCGWEKTQSGEHGVIIPLSRASLASMKAMRRR